MKRVGLRLAGAVLAISMCFAASANAYGPVAYAPVNAPSGAKVASRAFIPTLVVLVVVVVVRAITQRATTQALEQVNPVTQFDNTK